MRFMVLVKADKTTEAASAGPEAPDRDGEVQRRADESTSLSSTTTAEAA